MADIASMLNAFSEVAAHPSKELDKHLAAGKPAPSFDWESAGGGWQTVLR